MWPYPKVVAHRCGGRLAPENTLAAVRCGLKYGFHAVEFDAMLARDAVPIVMHDPHFGRTIQGKGAVIHYTAQEISRMDAGSWFSPEYSGEPVPLLAQMIEFCQQNEIWMDIEIKPYPGAEVHTGHAVAQMVRQMHPSGVAGHAMPPLLTSFSFDALMAAKIAAPTIARGWLVDVIPPDWRERLDRLGSTILETNHKNLTPAMARKIKQAGIGLFCYTVNVPERARELLSWGVDGFCTDRIDLIGPDFA